MLYCDKCNDSFTPRIRPGDAGIIYCPKCGNVTLSETRQKLITWAEEDDAPPIGFPELSVPLILRGDMNSYIIFKITGKRTRNIHTDESEVNYVPTIVGFKQGASPEEACVDFAKETQQLGDYVAMEVKPVAIQFGAAPSALLPAPHPIEGEDG